jgi:hypothetical protein
VSAPLQVKIDTLLQTIINRLPAESATAIQTIESAFAEFFLANPEIGAGPPADEEASIDAKIDAEINASKR